MTAEHKHKPEPAPAQTRDPEALAKQLRFFKGVTVAALLACAGVVGWFVYQRHQGSPVQILLDGKPVATARNMTAAATLIRAAEREQTGGAPYPDDAFKPQQKIQFLRVSRDIPIDTETSATHALASALNLHVRAYAILVNDHSTVGLPTEEAAMQTLSTIKNHYERMPPSAPLAAETEFLETVVVQRMGLPSSQLRAAAPDAAPYFWTPTRTKTYTVQPHDTGYSISRKNHIPFTDFLAANSGRDMNRLKPGDTVNIAKASVMVHVKVVKQIQTTEGILANVPADEAGKERVTYAVTYINGEETGRKVLGMQTLEKTKTRYSL
jgi:hypothetical protein